MHKGTFNDIERLRKITKENPECLLIGTSFEGWNHAQTKKQLKETTKVMKETLERDSEELKRKREKAQEAMEMNGKNKEEIGK